MKKWIMIEENYGGDNWPKVFDTQEEANKVAVKTWDSLTAAEKKKKHVFVICETYSQFFFQLIFHFQQLHSTFCHQR